ncbi:hypothetical protein BBI01_01180 [Chryseobacterium artocarpi]|uniref:Uncharacterized protein n=1 Tax=Chryseobacterium artocarpi TaxID=1414727 RepID=A0A1B8ZZY9_9FLAO|nr:hypothetical protein [Chryseobacterium artocarpi]OCA77104.1 hypothetical protein BBI01_01180 [Chryseobacterium artocarpi]
MASKQLNFYITPNDYERINTMISENDIIVLCKSKIFADNNIVYTNKLPNIDEEIFQVYFTDSRFLERIKILSTNNGIRYFDIDESYLLEFDLGGFYPYDRTILQRSRFYYVKSFYNAESNLEKKSDLFCDWADGIIKNFKNEILRKYSKEKYFFYSESAINWIEENNAIEKPGGLGWKKP